VFQTHDHQNRPGRDAGGEQVPETLDAGGGLADANRAFMGCFPLLGSFLSIKRTLAKYWLS